MKQRSPDLISSFRHAFAGLGYVIKTQRNARLHALVSLAAFALSIYLDLSNLEWALIIFAMGLVWFSESFNTALEQVVDLLQPEVHPLARAGKDTAAAAVMLAAVASVFIGALVWGPRLLAKIASG